MDAGIATEANIQMVRAKKAMAICVSRERSRQFNAGAAISLKQLPTRWFAAK